VKNLSFLFLLIISFFSASAQKYVPVIKEGTVLNYDVMSSASGQHATITLKYLTFTPPIKMSWNIPFVGAGTFEMSAKSLESGTKLFASEPDVDDVTKLDDNQTVLVLSKATFNDLVNTKSFKVNGYTFNVQPDTAAFKINQKDADVFHAVSTKGHRELWILNNPAWPLVCKSLNVSGIDYSIVSVQ